MKRKTLSIVVSVYNEETGLSYFWENLEQEISSVDADCIVIFVNDGSTDKSQLILKNICKDNNNVQCITFSKNFGHEAAMLAGVDYSDSDAIICMDADLQHPPSEISKMFNLHLQGHDLVSMVRSDTQDLPYLKKVTSKLFYKILNMLSSVYLEENASDFFLISKRIANVLKSDFRERNRFLRGFVQIVGFSKTHLPYTANVRAYGESKYSLFKLLKLSINAVVAFSKLPLILGLIVGCVFAFFSIMIGFYSMIMYFAGNTPPGYTTLIVFLSITFSIQFFLIGIIGVYIGFNFEETKKRPIYIIDHVL